MHYAVPRMHAARPGQQHVPRDLYVDQGTKAIALVRLLRGGSRATAYGCLEHKDEACTLDRLAVDGCRTSLCLSKAGGRSPPPATT